MKTALIFLHGDLADLSRLPAEARNAKLIIAADGGAEHALQAGITPHIVIGDLDSISDTTRNKLKDHTSWQTYPREKDFTDAELAIQHALKQHATIIYIVGFLGRRLDHMFANLLYLSTIPAEIILIEGHQKLTFVRKGTVLTGKKGYEVSLIPLTSDCEGVSTEGLAYPLKNERLPYGSTRGISNVMLGEKASVTVSGGILICIQSI